MWGKVLIDGFLPVVVVDDNRLLDGLRQVGWKGGEDAADDLDVTVRSPPEGMQVWSGGVCILNDSDNPLSPPEWWQAVSRLEDTCAVMVAQRGALGLHPHTEVSSDAFNAARESGRTVAAIAKVLT